MASKWFFAIFVLTLCIQRFSFAQLPIKWSAVNEGSESDAQFLIASTNNKTYVLNRKSGFLFRKDKWFVDVFNDSTLKKDNEEELIFLHKHEQIQETFCLKNSPYLFANRYKNNIKTLSAYAIHENGKTQCIDSALVEIKNLESRNDYSFHLYQSRDSSKLCVFHFTPNPDVDEKPLQIDLFDSSMHKLASQTVLLPFKNRETYFLDAISVNDKAAFFLKVADDDKMHVFTIKTYSYYIVECNISNATSNIISLNLSKKSTVLGSSFYLDKDNNFGICGFHKFTTDKNDAVVKPFIHKMASSIGTANFADDYAQPNVSLNIIKDNNPYNYEPLLTYTLNDGKVMMVSENSYVETSCITDYRSGIQRCNFYYHKDNIDGYLFDDTNDTKRKFLIAKKQISINDDGYFLGVTSGLVNGSLFFIYNDSKKNVAAQQPKDEPHYMNSAKKANVVMAKVDANGNVTKQTLFTNVGSKTVFVPNKSMMYSNGKVVLYCKRNNKYTIGIGHIQK